MYHRNLIRKGMMIHGAMPAPPGYLKWKREAEAAEEFDARAQELDEERAQLAARMTALQNQIAAIAAKKKS